MYKAQHYGYELCAVILPLYETGMLSSGVLQPSEHWHALFNDPFETLEQLTEGEERSEQTYYCNALLNTFNILHVAQEDLHVPLHCLRKLVERALKVKDSTSVQTIETFATGNGLRFLIEKANDDSELMSLSTLR